MSKTNTKNTAVESAIVADNTNDEALKPRKMSTTLKKYRGKYQAVLSATGKVSMDNGKPVAVLLRGLEPETVCHIAEELLGFTEGALVAKYAHLNRGQMRMNAGNRLANSVKKGIISLDDVEAAINTLS